MNLWQVLLVAVGLSMDAFAVAISAGTSRHGAAPRAVFRISFHFGLFQALMPIAGWLLATAVAGLVSAFDHWIAFGLLAFIGVRMILAARDGEKDEERAHDPSRGFSLVALSVATSIDAFAVGISLRLLGERIVWPSMVIGVVTGILSLLGMRAGTRLGSQFGRRVEFAGGLLLLGLGCQILYSHLAA